MGDLDALDRLNAALGEAEAEEEELVEDEEDVDVIQRLLESYPHAPSREKIEGWKARFGAVHAYIPDDDRVFLFRPLKGLEAKAIKQKANIFAQTQASKEDPEAVHNYTQETIVRACLLFPEERITGDANFFNMANGGLAGTLYGLVMENSDFVSPQKAISQTVRL